MAAVSRVIAVAATTRPCPSSRQMLLALALAAAATGGWAADTTPLDAQVRKLGERVEQLEKRNEELEKALLTERLSEKEPELVTRLKAVEYQALSMQAQARRIEALDGVSVSGSVTSVLQRASARATVSGQRETRANYRGDVAVTLPGGELGDIEGQIFTQFRFGQGTGVALRRSYTSTPNTTAFETAAGADDSFGIVAQAWYQLTVPLPRDGIAAHSRQRLEINVGKMDPFVFFDGNAAADDESVRFMSNAFVHNPLLDSGGDIAADAYGFQPGARLAYVNEVDGANTWGVSIAAFGAGAGANFSGSLGKPLVIGQIEWGTKLALGLPGTYRLYGWSNGSTTDFDGAAARHAGWGVSFDQRLGDDLTLFGRLGGQTRGRVRFDRALTLGAEVLGNAWGRGADALGLAVGALRTSTAFAAGSATVDADGDGVPDHGYTASGSERLGELYYRIKVNGTLELTPDFQWIQRPGGEAGAAAVKMVGLRVRIGF